MLHILLNIRDQMAAHLNVNISKYYDFLLFTCKQILLPVMLPLRSAFIIDSILVK